MNKLLKIGRILTSETGKKYKIREFLGSGGQGEVYSALIGRKKYAIKWYFSHTATKQQRIALENIIMTGKPDDRFLWPSELIFDKNIKGFGYVMPLRPYKYKNIVDLMKRRIEPTFEAVITAAIQLVESFMKLHSKGLCYRDISFGNVFFDPSSGDILICDNDNVTSDKFSKAGVLGTPRFMAPEIVRGDKLPNIKSDLFSLSILLFYMFMMHHPLEGKREAKIKCFDLPAMTELYGTNPVFIFHPKDLSNRPIKGYHDNAIEFWKIYPSFLKNIFIRAFTDGISYRKRVNEKEWLYELTKLRDSIIYCSCGMENFYDVYSLRNRSKELGSCWACGKKLELPPRIRIGRNIVMLRYNKELYPHHISIRHLFNFTKCIAKVIRHPKLKNVWGIKNLSTNKWKSINKSGKKSFVKPGQSVTIESGMRINFGEIEGEIRI